MYTTPLTKYCGKKENARKQSLLLSTFWEERDTFLKQMVTREQKKGLLVKLTLASVKLQLKVYLISIVYETSGFKEKIFKQKRNKPMY